MQYSNNYFCQTTEQNNKIKSIKAKHTILSEYLVEVLDYMRTQGIDIKFSRIPSEFIVDGDKGTGWYGPVDGTIRNNNNDHEIYADAIWGGCFNDFKSNEPILNLTTGGGNGGPNFNFFERTFISVDTLPKLKNIPFDSELAERETEALNALIDPIYTRYYRAVSDRTDELLKTPKYIKVKKIIEICNNHKVTGLYWIKSEAERIETQAYSFFSAEAQREKHYTLPSISGIYTNTKNYYRLQLEINRNINRNKTAPDFDIIIGKYNDFVMVNADKFV